MLVTVTIRDGSDATDRVDAEAPTYEQALSAAREKVPEGWNMIAIRTDRD
ncbi:hypothetical protein SPF06_18665 [Sinomonas sp. JGH33]|uniref:Uncharacterized protein n=1 Tax=Sinomonas terricola TaxID=3110330 RepID=A0ABU5TAM6_9MICC|nr:hypothetical protein [Sinomonas sp. JGH33]MEA5456751.1 hypothetical protein [Sinomonas sp. JGH33]